MRSSKGLGMIISSLMLMSIFGTAQSPTFIHKKKYVMGTVFEVVAYDNSLDHASAAIDGAFHEVTRLDEIMSNYKPDSELSHLNRTAHFQAETVSPDLYRIIEESLRYSKASNGKFDITVAPLVNYWKSVMRGERTRSISDEQKLRGCTGFEKIALLPPDRVEFRSACLQIDLGAIGKGYAVDRMADILRSKGVSSALVNAGGSTIYAIGSPPHELGWRVHLRDPSGKTGREVLLLDNSVSTSEQTAPDLLGGGNAGHIIDPETGQPAKAVAAVSAIARTATASDALSTTLLLLGSEQGATLIQNTVGTAAIWITATGKIETVSSGPRISFLQEKDPALPSPSAQAQ
jgi:thiamine biosynthesis lipoprotein